MLHRRNLCVHTEDKGIYSQVITKCLQNTWLASGFLTKRDRKFWKLKELLWTPVTLQVLYDVTFSSGRGRHSSREDISSTLSKLVKIQRCQRAGYQIQLTETANLVKATRPYNPVFHRNSNMIKWRRYSHGFFTKSSQRFSETIHFHVWDPPSTYTVLTSFCFLRTSPFHLAAEYELIC